MLDDFQNGGLPGSGITRLHAKLRYYANSNFPLLTFEKESSFFNFRTAFFHLSLMRKFMRLSKQIIMSVLIIDKLRLPTASYEPHNGSAVSSPEPSYLLVTCSLVNDNFWMSSTGDENVFGAKMNAFLLSDVANLSSATSFLKYKELPSKITIFGTSCKSPLLLGDHNNVCF